MKRKLLTLMLLLVVIAGGTMIWNRATSSEDSLSSPLLNGKTVLEWLETPDPDLHDAILPSDHPLALAGPEIIPNLIAAIEKEYPERGFMERHYKSIPEFLRKHIYGPKNSQGTIRTIAAFRLGIFGETASNAVPTLITLLNDPREYKYTGGRSRVIQALGNIGPPAREAVPILVNYLNHTNLFNRFVAVNSLLKIGLVPADAVPVLKDNFTGPNYDTANMALAIWIAEPSPEALDRITEMLNERQNSNTRAHMAESFRFVTDIPDEILPLMKEMLYDEDNSVRQGAALALARPELESLDRILEVLMEGVENGQFQIPCAEALGNLGPLAVDAIPALEEKINDRGGYVISTAARNALKKIRAE